MTTPNDEKICPCCGNRKGCDCHSPQSPQFRRIEELEALVLHVWVHEGYPQNGYLQMTTKQKKEYFRIIGAWFDPLKPVFEKLSKHYASIGAAGEGKL